MFTSTKVLLLSQQHKMGMIIGSIDLIYELFFFLILFKPNDLINPFLYFYIRRVHVIVKVDKGI